MLASKPGFVLSPDDDASGPFSVKQYTFNDSNLFYDTYTSLKLLEK